MAATKGKTKSKSAAGSAASRAKDAQRQKSEVSGVALIALGVLIGAYLFFSAGGFLGEILGTALFALFGMISYALPVIFLIVGILYIRGTKHARIEGSGWFLLLGILFLVTLTHATKNVAYEGVGYMEYLNQALGLGRDARLGGGFIGGALCYPLLKLGGPVCVYIVSITVVLICAVIVSGVSLRDLGESLGESVQSTAETARETQATRRASKEKMFTLTLDEETKAPVKTKASSKRAAKKPAGDDDLLDFPALNGAPRKSRPSKPVKKAVEPYTTDIWADRDLEPADDVPQVVKKPSRSASKTSEAPLPDTSKLFGAHDASDVPPAKRAPKKPAAPGAYVAPSVDLLDSARVHSNVETESPEDKARILIDALSTFDIPAKITEITAGSNVTRIEFQIGKGVRIARVTALSNDLSMALSAPNLRMQAPIPGKNAIGIEIPSKATATVVLRDIIDSREFKSSASPLTMALGKEPDGRIVTADLTRMPHMLIAGATGSGKSVCINDIIVSLLYKSSPQDVKFVLIDPKKVEMTFYANLPHLLIPVVTEVKKAASALRWACNEMDRRYNVFAGKKVRDISKFNEVASSEDRLPRIVIIIDEFADLMMVAPADVEDSVKRISQLGRASGIHLILATQRPDRTVITGLIKSNIPSRCAFAVSSATNSRIILDASGAEKLNGRGDMLFHPDGAGKPIRMQCCFISDEEVERVVNSFQQSEEQPAVSFDNEVIEAVDSIEHGAATAGPHGQGKQEDELLGAAVRVGLENGQISTSLLQRRLRVGYQRASRLIDMMEQAGYVSGLNGSKPRDMIVTRAQYVAIFGDDVPFESPQDMEE